MRNRDKPVEKKATGGAEYNFRRKLTITADSKSRISIRSFVSDFNPKNPPCFVFTRMAGSSRIRVYPEEVFDELLDGIERLEMDGSKKELLWFQLVGNEYHVSMDTSCRLLLPRPLRRALSEMDRDESQIVCIGMNEYFEIMTQSAFNEYMKKLSDEDWDQVLANRFTVSGSLGNTHCNPAPVPQERNSSLRTEGFGRRTITATGSGWDKTMRRGQSPDLPATGPNQSRGPVGSTPSADSTTPENKENDTP